MEKDGQFEGFFLLALRLLLLRDFLACIEITSFGGFFLLGRDLDFDRLPSAVIGMRSCLRGRRRDLTDFSFEVLDWGPS